VPKSPQAEQASPTDQTRFPDPERSEALLTVDLDALASNHAYLKRQAGAAEVAPVVKADAYGLGATEVARRLHLEGARTFFVARVSEGEALRRALGAQPAEIYVLDGALPGVAGRLEAAALTPVLNSLEQVRTWSAQARGGPSLPAALHIDTGMNRLGLTVDEAEGLAGDGQALAGLRLHTVMSHLACAEEADHSSNPRQLCLFAAVRPCSPTPARAFATRPGCSSARIIASISRGRASASTAAGRGGRPIAT
jgi:alanine racemase